jgi:hypothetical protein
MLPQMTSLFSSQPASICSAVGSNPNPANVSLVHIDCQQYENAADSTAPFTTASFLLVDATDPTTGAGALTVVSIDVNDYDPVSDANSEAKYFWDVQNFDAAGTCSTEVSFLDIENDAGAVGLYANNGDSCSADPIQVATTGAGGSNLCAFDNDGYNIFASACSGIADITQCDLGGPNCVVDTSGAGACAINIGAEDAANACLYSAPDCLTAEFCNGVSS